MSGVSRTKPKSKSTANTASHICEYCDKKFPFSSALDQHHRVHTGERPFSCNLCDYSASEKGSLTVHIRSHLQEKPFKCPKSGSGCNYSACSKSEVTQHHKIIHLGEKKFQCPISNCGHRFGQKPHLTQHTKTHEENPEKPFKCELCPYKTMHPRSLSNHMNSVHSDERNFKCPQEGCTFAAKMNGGLNRHVESHEEKTLVCHHLNCAYKTNVQLNLQHHMKLHNSDLEKKYKCRICDYSSHESGNLTRHMRIHTKETPYKCKIQGCQYEAKTSCDLNKHVRAVHETIRPFKCPFSSSGCSYATTVKGNLRRHQKSQHAEALN